MSQITCNELCYVGLKVKIQDAQSFLTGSLLKAYNEMGYLYVTDHTGDSVEISYSPGGGMYTTCYKSRLIPILPEDILKVIKNKKSTVEQLHGEIEQLEQFVNSNISNVNKF